MVVGQRSKGISQNRDWENFQNSFCDLKSAESVKTGNGRTSVDELSPLSIGESNANQNRRKVCEQSNQFAVFSNEDGGQLVCGYPQPAVSTPPLSVSLARNYKIMMNKINLPRIHYQKKTSASGIFRSLAAL